MSNIMNSIYNIRILDDFAKKNTFIHRINPVIKLITTIIYLFVVVSFGRYEINNLIPFIFYPIIIFTFAEIPLLPILKRLLLIEPLIIGIGILNPLFDNELVVILGFSISSGWITFLSIIIRSTLTVTVSILLIATTDINKLACALRAFKVPKIFVLQLLLTYRYISVLMEEVSRMMRAYNLRAPNQKGIHHSVWGTFSGQLLLRTFERAQRIYESMSLRGFKGEYNTGDKLKFYFTDWMYFICWITFFIFAKYYNIPNLIGTFLTGVIK